MENWLLMNAEVINKQTSSYTKKDKSEWTNYTLTVFTGGTTNPQIRVNEKQYLAIAKWESYLMPIWYRTFLYWASKDQVWMSFFLRNWEVTSTITWKVAIKAPSE